MSCIIQDVQNEAAEQTYKEKGSRVQNSQGGRTRKSPAEHILQTVTEQEVTSSCFDSLGQPQDWNNHW